MFTDRCQVGQEPNAANTACVPCDLGFYQDVPESKECKMCLAGYSTRNMGSNSSSACESKQNCKSAMLIINYAFLYYLHKQAETYHHFFNPLLVTLLVPACFIRWHVTAFLSPKALFTGLCKNSVSQDLEKNVVCFPFLSVNLHFG